MNNYETMPSPEMVKKTAEALIGRNFDVIVVDNKEEALDKLKSLIPEGASAMNGSSTTLEQIGFVDYLKSGSHKWNNLHAAILQEKDPQKQAGLRKQSGLADYFLGSVQAITESGQLLVASATGSQIAPYAFSADKVILVAGANKIVLTLKDAFTRLEEYVYPLEDQRMKSVGYPGSVIGKVMIYERELNPGRTTLVLVNEKLGF